MGMLPKTTQDELITNGLSASLILHPYQLTGVNWLIEKYNNDHGCILADEMGLGKTCQTISFLLHVNVTCIGDNNHLIISPLSVLTNWESELQRFAPNLSFIKLYGDKDEREDILHKFDSENSSIPIVLTTYDVFMKEFSSLKRRKWHMLVVDEAQRLKNHQSLFHQMLCDLKFRSALLLTGTPVQNNLEELYSLLNVVSPNNFHLDQLRDFVSRYSDIEQNDDAKAKLHSLLKEYLLRRSKSDVSLDLPLKEDLILYHGMTSLQKKYYKGILLKDKGLFDLEYNPSNKKTSFNNILMQLRKCVIHPYLFYGVEPEPFQIGEHLISASGKLILLDQILKYLITNGHKVLLFSQFTSMLDILQDYLEYRQYAYERLDGSVRSEERFLAIKNFNSNRETSIFLISTKAGGVGLNLTSADTVIFVDSDFNPQNDLQAAARVHRIGQTKPVKIVHLVGENTAEEIILKRSSNKLKLTDAVIEDGNFTHDINRSVENTSLLDVIKFGIGELLSNDESTVKTIDMEKVLGISLNGMWKIENDDKNVNKTQQSENKNSTEHIESMYQFEGTDYTKEKMADDDAFLMEMINSDDDTDEGKVLLRTSKSTMNDIGKSLQFPKRERKKMTSEQIEARKLKMQETLKQRAEEKAERAREKLERFEEMKKQEEEHKHQLWIDHCYVSTNLPLDEDSEDIESLTDNFDNKIRYVMGNVLHPQVDSDESAIIIHCLDNSGSWGRGGLFTAISNQSNKPEEMFSIAFDMKDLHLGDAHNVSIDDTQYITLVIAQERLRNKISDIKLDSLVVAFQRIAQFAKLKSASVHLPRIGYNTANFNWYGTEKVIQKYLVARGIPTYIYYFKRKGVKRVLENNSSDLSPRARTFDKKQKINKIVKSDDYSESDNNSTDSDNNCTDSDYQRSDEESDDSISSHEFEEKTNSSVESIDKNSSDESNDTESIKSPIKAIVGNPASNSKNIFENAPENSSPSLELFDNISIHFYHCDGDKQRHYSKYIMKNGGDIHTTIEDSTSYIILDKILDDDLKEELINHYSEFPQAEILSILWLKECYSKNTLIYYEPYTIDLDTI